MIKYSLFPSVFLSLSVLLISSISSFAECKPTEFLKSSSDVRFVDESSFLSFFESLEKSKQEDVNKNAHINVPGKFDGTYSEGRKYAESLRHLQSLVAFSRHSEKHWVNGLDAGGIEAYTKCLAADSNSDFDVFFSSDVLKREDFSLMVFFHPTSSPSSMTPDLEVSYFGGENGVTVGGNSSSWEGKIKVGRMKPIQVHRPSRFEEIELLVTVDGHDRKVTVPAAIPYKIETKTAKVVQPIHTGYGKDWGPGQLCINLDELEKGEASLVPESYRMQTVLGQTAGTFFAGDCKKGIGITGGCKGFTVIDETPERVCAYFYAHTSNAGSAVNAEFVLRAKYLLLTPLSN